MTRLPRVVIAAPASGQGKTTIATGLMAALAARGLAVSGHKVGPDYIDAGYHAVATGRPGRNLDPHLQGEQRLVPLLLHGAATPTPADIAVIEGVMGLHDGATGRAGFASTAHVARLLGAPVVLVVDVSGAARSVAATIHGFATFDPPGILAGVILNKVGSATHEAEVRAAVGLTGVPVLGALRRDADLATPSRHLGLVPAAERGPVATRTVRRLGEQVAAALDLPAIIAVAGRAPDLPGPPWHPARELAAAGAGPPGPPATVAVASGSAFTFRYAETDELLAAAGLRVVPVDPLHAEQLPPACAGLYLGGGFPQLHAAELAANGALRGAVAGAAARGLPIVAECAGLLYLCKDIDGTPMAGVLDASARMTGRLTLGYRDAVATTDTVLAPVGTRVTGHEFHRTEVSTRPGGRPAWRLSRPAPAAPAPTDDGFATGPTIGDPPRPAAAPGPAARSGPVPTVHASYLHVHWAGHPALAGRFAAAVAMFATSDATAGSAGRTGT